MECWRAASRSRPRGAGQLPRPTSGDVVEWFDAGRRRRRLGTDPAPFRCPPLPPYSPSRCPAASRAPVASPLPGGPPRGAADSHGTRRTAGRAAGRAHRLGDPGGRRRRPARGRGGRRGRRHRDRRVRHQPVRADPPRQPARVPDGALRRRGAASPRRDHATPPQLGRLRPVPQGPGRCRRVAGTSTSADRSPPSPTRGSATTRGPPTSRRRCRPPSRRWAARWTSFSQTELYRSGTYREQILTAVRRRDDIERVLARYRTKVAPEPESEEEAADLADSVATDEDDDPDAAAGLERFPFKPYCRSADATRPTSPPYDDETTDLSYTCSVVRGLARHQPRHPGRGQAGVEGRLADALGLRGRRLRARRGRPRDARARRTPSARSW